MVTDFIDDSHSEHIKRKINVPQCHKKGSGSCKMLSVPKSNYSAINYQKMLPQNDNSTYEREIHHFENAKGQKNQSHYEKEETELCRERKICFMNFLETPSYPLISIITHSRYYQPIREIGTGSFGKALLVKDLRRDAQNKQYVMKMIDTARLNSKERADAVNEVQLLASLRHPYIITYRDSFVEKNFLCIVMDYADGGDLFKAIAQQRSRGEFFSESQILRWFTQATLALKYLHEKHILHRDLKSQNLFLMSKGRLRLGDFGIAKALDCTSAFTKTQIGTPYYLSPEICKNQPYSWASDIWSLGCILYELATLRVPFNAPNITTLLNKITSKPPPQLPEFYSAGLRQLCRDCLQREWKKRPSAALLLQREITQNEIRSMLFEEQKRRRHQTAVMDLQMKEGIKKSLHPSFEKHPQSPKICDKNDNIPFENSVHDRKNYQQFSIVGDLEVPIPPCLTLNGQEDFSHAFWSQSTSAGDSPQRHQNKSDALHTPKYDMCDSKKSLKDIETNPSCSKSQCTPRSTNSCTTVTKQNTEQKMDKISRESSLKFKQSSNKKLSLTPNYPKFVGDSKSPLCIKKKLHCSDSRDDKKNSSHSLYCKTPTKLKEKVQTKCDEALPHKVSNHLHWESIPPRSSLMGKPYMLRLV